MTGPAVITDAPQRSRRWGRLRGAWAVLVLLLSALDHLVSAVIGSRPAATIVRRFAVPIAAAWRSGRRRPIVLPNTYLDLDSPVSERSPRDGFPRR